MNAQAIRILFLKDLFLSRWPLFGYLVGGLASAAVACLPNEAAGFIGFIMMVTVTIAAGIHLIGVLLLAESADMTRTFVMSLPISLLDYSVAKIAVVLVTFLIGVVMAYLLGLQAAQYGASVFVIDGVALGMVREFSPLLVAIIIAGRSGAAFTAELGTMRLSQETDAIAMLVPAYRTIERAARAAGFDPDRPPHLKKITETL